MHKNILILLFITGFAAKLQATDKLLLYHVNKQVQWLHDGKKETARRGVFLLPKQEIIIPAQAEVMIVQEDGKSLLLDKPGTYSYLQIKKRILELKAESVSKNFFAYVFEKFLSGEGVNEKQKVAAVVYRSRTAMFSPEDSSFVFINRVLSWKPERSTMPYKIEININQKVFDTIVRNQTTFTIPETLLSNQPQLIQWRCYPADSKQKPKSFVLLMPKKEDAAIIKKQLAVLKKNYNSNPALLKLMNTDLLLQWIVTYGLK